jgi:hypothetical protein
MPDRSRKRPRDPNQLAKLMVDMLTDAAATEDSAPKVEGKNAAAVALGRMGGLKGGAARAKALSPAKRKAIAKKAAAKRWGKGRE